MYIAATLCLPLILGLKVSAIKQTYKYVLLKQIKAAIQLVSSNMQIIVKILRSNLVALSLISSLIFIKQRYIRVQIMLIQISNAKYKEQRPAFNIFSISRKLISLLLLVRSSALKLPYILYNLIQNLVTPTNVIYKYVAQHKHVAHFKTPPKTQKIVL